MILKYNAVMNKLVLESENNKLVYRELFFKAHDSIKKQLEALKAVSYCQKCKSCCQIRYTSQSPSQIFELAKQGENISKNYMELFIPYSANKSFNYEFDSVDIKENHQQALQANKDYVEKLIATTSEPVYFYFCKHLSGDKKCLKHDNQNFLCTSFPNSITTILPNECGYKQWQQVALNVLENDISKDIWMKLQDINKYRENFSCKKTGTCCKLASSEFSYDELKEKAKKGDKFAIDFTSVFIPYETEDEAREIFPEFVEMLYEKLGTDEKVYFYHCPHITEDNLCSIYNKRPSVCRDFPDNPLSILPPHCGYCEWKEDVHVGSMLLHAMVEIVGFNKEKIERALM